MGKIKRTAKHRHEQHAPHPPVLADVRSGWQWLAVLTVLLVGYFTLAPSFKGPFTFDDDGAIVENVTIRQLWPVWQALVGPDETAVAGRPVANLSLAVNYALAKADPLDPWGYHAFNLAVHLLSGLVLLGLARRTLELPQWPDYITRHALPMALVIALAWVVHPLQTEAVAYVIQRTELLVGLFYLLTLYAALRAAGSRWAVWWSIVAVVCCCLGMASKEVMVSAPLAVLLYDRAMLFPSLAEALRRRWPLYAALAATWIVLITLMLTRPREQSVGFHLEVSPLQYLLTQCYAIGHYLSLAFWPHPDRLVLDYGTGLVDLPALYLPGMLVIALLAAITLWGWMRLRWLGFLGTCFFMLLAPSSSFVPIVTEVMAERRMYLPLAALLAATVVGMVYAGASLGERWARRASQGRGGISAGMARQKRLAGGLAAVVSVAVISTLGWAARTRLDVYGTELALWADTVAKRPDNYRALVNWGRALKEDGRLDEAEAAFRRSLAVNPRYALAYNNLGVVLTEKGQIEEAAEAYSQAIAYKRDFPQAYNNLAVALIRLNKLDEAQDIMRHVLAAEPDDDQAHYNMSGLLKQIGDDDAALGFLERTIELTPRSGEAHNNLGILLAARGQNAEALEHLAIAMELMPEEAEVVFNYGNTLASMGRFDEAAPYIRQALKLEPTNSKAHNTLAVLLSVAGDNRQAEQQVRLAIEHDPANLEARCNLAVLLQGKGSYGEAAVQLQHVLQQQPDHPAALRQLAELHKLSPR